MCVTALLFNKKACRCVLRIETASPAQSNVAAVECARALITKEGFDIFTSLAKLEYMLFNNFCAHSQLSFT